MRFELDPPGVRFSDKELLDDLRRVAALKGKSFVHRTDYEAHGRFSRTTIRQRFGSWKAAHKRAGLNANAREPVSKDRLRDDLQRVSQLLARHTISLPEYRRLGRWSERPFIRVFGSWTQALSDAGLDPHPQFKERIPDEALFENLENVWTRLGRAPRYSEFHQPLTSISRGTYCSRFGSWRNALESFIGWVNSDREFPPPTAFAAHAPVEPRSEAGAASDSDATPERRLSRRTPREINLRLRFRILQRDRFTCKACGRSPAAVAGLVLHVDHVVPWSAGGETVVDNLQTLCQPCNLGKGNQHCGDAR